jgi:hypothetical protein
MGIGAYGTTRPNMRGTPKGFKKIKGKRLGMCPYTWGYIYSEGLESSLPIDREHGVHATIWLDNNWVMLYSTVHGPCHNWNDYREAMRKRPPISMTNSWVVRQVFGDETRKMLPISKKLLMITIII